MIFFASAVVAAAAYFFVMRQKHEQRLAAQVQISSAVVDTIENLKALNDRFMQKIKEQEQQLISLAAQNETQEARITYHDVKTGETIFTIAKKYYGDALEYRKILRENNLPDPPQLTAGMRLKIILPENQ